MKRAFFIVVLFSLLVSGCVPLAAVPVSSSSGTGIPDEPTLDVFPVEAVAGPGDEPATDPEKTPSTEVPAVEHIIAYLGQDGNIWLVDVSGDVKTQITTDAASFGGDATLPVIFYENPEWSSDGHYLAFERQTGTPTGEGYDFTFALMIYDFESHAMTMALDGQTAGFAWQPGSHLLAFALAVQPGYFATRGGVDASLAGGIYGLDASTLSTSLLVGPEGGYALANPIWAPDGQVLSFEEVKYMEGRGSFAFYDFKAGRYNRWDKAIGNVSWSPDGARLLHDNLNYSPDYSERVYEINRDGSGERQLSADVENGYASNPLYSPDGSRIAYIAVQGIEPDISMKLVLLPVGGGEAREFGAFNQIYDLSWTADGQGLLIATGDYPDLRVMLVSTLDGSQTELAEGWQAAMRP
jgi:Tol biopolymer transport system component